MNSSKGWVKDKEVCQNFQMNLWFLTNRFKVNSLNVFIIKKLILFNTYCWNEEDFEALLDSSKIKMINMGSIEEMVEMTKLNYMWFLQLLHAMANCCLAPENTVDTSQNLVACTKVQDQIWEQSMVDMWQDICRKVPFSGDLLQKHILMAKGNFNMVPELNLKICQMWNERFKLLVNSTIHGGLTQMPFEQNAAVATMLVLANYESLSSFQDQINQLVVSEVCSMYYVCL